MPTQTDLPPLTPETPVVDQNLNYTKRFMMGGDNAQLSWNGQHLRLMRKDMQDVLFDLAPRDIKKIHIYQRIGMRFYLQNGQKIMTYYPYLMGKQLESSFYSTLQNIGGPGIAVRMERDITQVSPINAWMSLYKQLHIKVWDDSLVPPNPISIILWTWAPFIGAMLTFFIVGFCSSIIFG